MAPRRGSAQGPFADLPGALLLRCVAALPVSDWLSVAGVCSAWRAVLAHPSLWQQHLDLSRASGVPRPVSAALLHAAAARAAGGLRTLDISGCNDLTADDLAHVLADNAAALTQLRVCHASDGAGGTALDVPTLEALCTLAPRLSALHADVRCKHADAARLLRNEAPFGPLRISRAVVCFEGCADGAPVRRVLDDVAAHGGVAELALLAVRLADTDVAAVAETARALALRALTVDGLLPAGGARHLAPLLAPGGALTSLALCGSGLGAPLFDTVQDAEAFGAALKASGLRELTLYRMRLWRCSAAADALAAALAGHPTLRVLRLCGNDPHAGGFAITAGRALSRVLAADAAALIELDISGCQLGDMAMEAVLGGLRRNTHLQSLWALGNRMGGVLASSALLSYGAGVHVAAPAVGGLRGAV